MLLLASTSDKLQVVTDAAIAVDVHASYADYSAPSTVTPGRKNTAISTATTTDVVLAPASSTLRNVKYLSIRNKGASPVTVTVQHTDGTTTVELWSVTLSADEKMAWNEGVGMQLFDSVGRLRIVEGAGIVDTRVLAADQSNSTTTLTEVTGLKMTGVGVGTWFAEYLIRYNAGVTTTGVRFSVNHDGTVSFFLANRQFIDASATAATAAPDQDAVGAASHVVAGFAARAKSTLGWGTTISVDTAGGDMFELIMCHFQVTAEGNGELELWHGSEVAAISTVKAGSAVRLTKLGV